MQCLGVVDGKLFTSRGLNLGPKTGFTVICSASRQTRGLDLMVMTAYFQILASLPFDILQFIHLKTSGVAQGLGPYFILGTSGTVSDDSVFHDSVGSQEYFKLMP
jgi:hypothetical protein